MSMEGKTVIITGGNTGIGFAAAEDLVRQGAEVIITSRNMDRGRSALASIEEKTGKRARCFQLDLASIASIRQFASKVMEEVPRIDVLINNAGLILSRRQETEDGFEMTFGVNHLGHFLLTQLLLDRLKESAPSRIVNVASEAHRAVPMGLDFDDLQAEASYREWKAYGGSKLANIYFTRELARRLEGTGVTTYALHPGVVATRFALDGDTKGLSKWFYRLAWPFMRSPKGGAKTVVYTATKEGLEDKSGGYWSNCRPRKPTRVARNDEAARRLWTVSEELLESAQSRSVS